MKKRESDQKKKGGEKFSENSVISTLYKRHKNLTDFSTKLFVDRVSPFSLGTVGKYNFLFEEPYFPTLPRKNEKTLVF